jgi:diacylglycerol O-acyltransferase / wax synthase
MKQLSGLDELYLALERPNQCMHVAVLGIYDPSTAPGGRVRLRDIMGHVRQRLDVSPVFRRRLVRVPFDLDRAYWVDEAKVDLEYHIRHIALPKPGDWRQLSIQVARLHSQSLDRAKPLWQAYVIEGLDNVEGVAPGSFAVYIKFHHAAVDGDSSAQLLRAMHSLIAVPEHHAPSKPIVIDAPPSAIELYTRSLGNVVPRGVRLWHALTTATFKMTSLASEAMYKRVASGLSWQASFREQLGWPVQASNSRFAGPVSSRRIVEGVGFDMAQVHRVRKWAGGATINDVFLTIIGGGLRRYLAACGDTPTADTATGMPAGQRDVLPGGDLGNAIGHIRIPLHLNIASGLARLDAIRSDVVDTPQTADIVGRTLLQQLADELPTRITTSMVHQWIGGYTNILTSNVRGPDVRLYLAGARLSRYYPIGAITDDVGLNISGFSYCDALWASVVSCRKMVPEPELLSRCLTESFDALCAEVDALEASQASMAEQRPRRRSGEVVSDITLTPHTSTRRKPGFAPPAKAHLPEHKARLQ